jgi:L-glyceraldehyde 3-phosphate reductase
MPYAAAEDRYDRIAYRRCGRSGLKLPAISLGLWHNFGDDMPLETQQAILRRAFDRGVTHFDLANNYGPPYGSAETNFGRHLADDFRPYRDELVISTKAGYDMWPGPYGEWGSRKYLLASLDQSLARMGLDYVDIFYSHRFDPETPLEETMGALDAAVRQGKALYAGISSYSPERTREAAAILRELGTPLLIHQPSYSMLNRWIEDGLLDALEDEGVGCIAFSPLAQGMLTDRYLDGVPEDSRAAQGKSLDPGLLTEQNLAHVRALNDLARARGQSLAQLALAWALRDARVTSVLVGASSVRQLDANLDALTNLDLTADELDAIDKHAVESGVNLWAGSSETWRAGSRWPGRAGGSPRGRASRPSAPGGVASRWSEDASTWSLATRQTPTCWWRSVARAPASSSTAASTSTPTGCGCGARAGCCGCGTTARSRHCVTRWATRRGGSGRWR